MELHEEYLTRRGVKAPCIKYVDKANLILRAKGQGSEWSWLHVNITSNGDTAHPQKYTFVVSANPTLYSTAEMNHFSQHSKVIDEQTWEWEQYESGLVKFCKDNAKNYTAIFSRDAVFVAWEMFVTNYDSWIAHFLPYRVQENVYTSLSLDVSEHAPMPARAAKYQAIKSVEDILREKFDKVHLSWKNIKAAVEQKNYADWLAKVVNEMA